MNKNPSFKIRFIRPGHAQKGYTLIELMMTLFVISALSAVAIPVVDRFVTHTEARAFVLQMEADVALSHKKAAATERMVWFEVNPTTRTYYIFEQIEGRKKMVKFVPFPRGVTASSLLELTFRPNKTFPGHADGGTINVKQGGAPFADLVITPFSVRTKVEWL